MPTSGSPDSRSCVHRPRTTEGTPIPEISHVQIAVPEQGTLNRVLREGGAQLFPQWLAGEPGLEARIGWWGIRGASYLADVPEGPAAGLVPRPFDDWGEAPRGLVLATVDLARAEADLAPVVGEAWRDAGADAVLGGRCRRLTLGRSILVLAEPTTEGYVAACLARFGEGPIAVALDGTTDAGQVTTTNPVSGGRATYMRIGPKTAPFLIFLPAG
jgi:hypothetical protein